jgi:hypothetical protein
MSGQGKTSLAIEALLFVTLIREPSELVAIRQLSDPKLNMIPSSMNRTFKLLVPYIFRPVTASPIQDTNKHHPVPFRCRT